MLTGWMTNRMMISRDRSCTRSACFVSTSFRFAHSIRQAQNTLNWMKPIAPAKSVRICRTVLLSRRPNGRHRPAVRLVGGSAVCIGAAHRPAYLLIVGAQVSVRQISPLQVELVVEVDLRRAAAVCIGGFAQTRCKWPALKLGRKEK